MSSTLLLEQKPNHIRECGENIIDGEHKEVFEQKLRGFLNPRDKKILITIYIDRLYFNLRDSHVFAKFMSRHKFYNLDVLLISYNPSHNTNHIKLNPQLRCLMKNIIIYPFDISKEQFKILHECYGSRKYPNIKDFEKAYVSQGIMHL